MCTYVTEPVTSKGESSGVPPGVRFSLRLTRDTLVSQITLAVTVKVNKNSDGSWGVAWEAVSLCPSEEI